MESRQCNFHEHLQRHTLQTTMKYSLSHCQLGSEEYSKRARRQLAGARSFRVFNSLYSILARMVSLLLLALHLAGY